jgi:hypothetical protein
MVVALAAAERSFTEIKIYGTRETAGPFLEAVHRRFLPFRRIELEEGEPAAEVCTDFVCQPRVYDPAALERLLA